MSRKSKKYRAKPFPLIAISFYRDRTRTLNCQVTANKRTWLPGDYLETNMRLFGAFLAEDKTLDEDDKKALVVFCRSFLYHHKIISLPHIGYPPPSW